MAARLTSFMIITVWKQPFWTECQKISKRICYANSFMESSHVFYLQSKYRNILFSVIMFCTCKWMYLHFSSSSCDTVYMYLKLSFSRSFQTLTETPCGISVLTVNYVKQCPTDALSWKMAAKRMNCESLIHNCLPNTKHRLNTKPVKFQYHCLINAWINATLEVCAFNRTIIGTLSVTKIQCSPFAILLLRS